MCQQLSALVVDTLGGCTKVYRDSSHCLPASRSVSGMDLRTEGLIPHWLSLMSQRSKQRTVREGSGLIQLSCSPWALGSGVVTADIVGRRVCMFVFACDGSSRHTKGRISSRLSSSAPVWLRLYWWRQVSGPVQSPAIRPRCERRHGSVFVCAGMPEFACTACSDMGVKYVSFSLLSIGWRHRKHEATTWGEATCSKGSTAACWPPQS